MCRYEYAQVPDQRGRMLTAVVELAAEKGYPALTTSEIIARGHVSRATFYAQFQGREECFLTALSAIAERLLGEVRLTVARAPPQRAPLAAADALLRFAADEQSGARLLFAGMLMGSSRSLDARDRLIERIAQVIDERAAVATPDAALSELPSALLAGSVCRLLACLLNAGERDFSGVHDELFAWIESYDLSRGEHCWQRLTQHGAPAPWPYLQPSPLRALPAPSDIRTRRSNARLRESRRRQLLFAAAEAIDRCGYHDTTVRMVARSAGVDKRVFYSLFDGKERLLREANDLLFGHVIAATAGAFASGESWPERIWLAAGALTQSLELNPALTRVALLQSSAAGASTARRVARFTNAFAIFLQEGQQQSLGDPGAAQGARSTLAQQAITTTVVELLCRQSRAAAQPDLAGLSGRIAFVSLAPFIGVRDAGVFVLEQLSAPVASAAP
jgi:AcrR family transcriptional regulator